MTRYTFRTTTLPLPAVGALAGCGSSGPSSADWVGKTHLLDTPTLAAFNWTKPKRFRGDIGAYLPQLLNGVEAGTGSDCSTFESYDVSRTNRAFNSQPYCPTLQAVQIEATRASAPFRAVTAADIAPSCSR